MTFDLGTAILALVMVELAALAWCIALVRVSASSQRSEALDSRRWTKHPSG